MDVVAGRDPHIAERQRLFGEQPAVGGGDLVGRGELAVARVAGDHVHRDAGKGGDRRVVGERPGAGGGRGAMGGKDAREAEALGRLGRLQALARDRRRDDSLRGHGLQRVGDGEGGEHRVGMVEPRRDALDQSGAREGPHRVMDEDAPRGVPAAGDASPPPRDPGGAAPPAPAGSSFACCGAEAA